MKLFLSLLMFAIVGILSMSACSSQNNELESLKAENERLKAELAAKDAEIQNLKTDIQKFNIDNKTEETNSSQNTKKLKEEIYGFYEVFSNHYNSLIDEFEKNKEKYDETKWTVFLNNWNNRLSDFRNQLDKVQVTGETYSLFYAKNQISSAATAMSAIWIKYSNILEGNKSNNIINDLKDLDNNIKKCLNEAKESLFLSKSASTKAYGLSSVRFQGRRRNTIWEILRQAMKLF